MHTILNKPLSDLKDEVIQLGLPSDQYKNHYFGKPLVS